MASQLYNYTPTELQKLLDESNSYKELLRKLGMCDHGSNYKTLRKVIAEYNLDLSKISENRSKINNEHIKNLHKNHGLTLEEILVENSTYNNGNNLKEKLFNAGLKERRCERCGLTEWQDNPIPFQLHHKNGIHNDNRLENLELLCPNCHAITDNFAGKNIDRSKQKLKTKKIRQSGKYGISEDGQRFYDGYGEYKILCPVCKDRFMNRSASMCNECYKKEKRKPKVSKEELFEIMETNSYYSAAKLLGVDIKTVSRWHKYYTNKERENDNMIIGSDVAPSREVLKTKIRTMSFVQIGKEYNVTDNSVRKWCDTYGLPRRVSEIKSISDEEWEKI